MISNFKFIIKNSLYVLNIFFIFYPNIFLKASNIPLKSENKIVDLKRNENSENHNGNEYILGVGDRVQIDFEGVEVFNNSYVISPDGYIYLPEIEKVLAQGKTTYELKKILEKLFSDVIYEPKINLFVNFYRPVNFYLSGEVNKPGLYELAYKRKEDFSSNSNLGIYNNALSQSNSYKLNKKSLDSVQISPKIFDAIKEGKGLTNYADLSKVTIIRNNPESNGGGKIKTEINFLKMLHTGDQSFNLRIMDGDSIIIPRNENPIKDQILSINKTNLSPDNIVVFITGNVNSAGAVNLKKGSSLIQAIASTGGKKVMTGNIEFIRFRDNGSSIKSRFRYDDKAAINTRKNPILMDGDVINVRRTILGTTSEVIGEFSRPLLGGFAIYSIFGD